MSLTFGKHMGLRASEFKEQEDIMMMKILTLSTLLSYYYFESKFTKNVHEF